MTWVVGVPVPFGYSIGCADIRVTFKDGTEKDCLQKIYQVGPVVCAAFAGSIRIGFAMLLRISQLLNDVEPGVAWDLDQVAQWWPDDALEVWGQMPENEQRLGSEFMLFGAHPQEGNPWPKPCVYTFKSPDFVPKAITGRISACSLGKGAMIKTYCEPVEELWNGTEDIMRLETGLPGGIAIGMIHMITDKLLALPIKGISPHMHMLLAFRGHVKATNNDIKYFKKDGSMELEPVLVMPPVFDNYASFLRASGGAAHAAEATG
jgi:hypothetical protein